MKVAIIYFSLVLALAGCTNNSSTEENRMLYQKMDSSKTSVVSRQSSVVDSAKITTDSPSLNLRQTKPKYITPSPPQTMPVQNPKTKLTGATALNDTVYYYYTGLPKRISVKVTPWNAGRRQLLFYNPFGEITYTCKDVRMSYSTITRLKKFHSNGAAAKIEIGDNPGAIMYWHETTITFDINNNPQWKTISRKPVESLEDAMNNNYYWNEKTRQWIKQEIIEEQAVPLR